MHLCELKGMQARRQNSSKTLGSFFSVVCWGRPAQMGPSLQLPGDAPLDAELRQELHAECYVGVGVLGARS